MQDARCQPYEEMAQLFLHKEASATVVNDGRDPATSTAENVSYLISLDSVILFVIFALTPCSLDLFFNLFSG
jgi:hypothetical protein